jgi:hypothetical protein
MYPTKLEISLDACLECRFGNHYSSTEGASSEFSYYQVRKTPRRPGSWASSSLFWPYSRRNAWATLHLLDQPDAARARSQDPDVKTLGYEPYNAGLMEGGQELSIQGEYMVTISDPMPPLFCAFLGDCITKINGVGDADCHSKTLVILEAVVDVASETVLCTVPSVTNPQVCDSSPSAATIHLPMRNRANRRRSARRTSRSS